MVDLLHPQESLSTTPPTPPATPTPLPPPIPEPVIAAPVNPTPSMPSPVVNQIGTTQQPHVRKPFPSKILAVLMVGILVLAGIGAGYYFLIIKKNSTTVSQTIPAVSGPISNLSQSAAVGILEAGATNNNASLNLNFDFPTSATTGGIVPEVEVQPTATAFGGESTNSGPFINATGHTIHLTVPVTGLKDGSYHWQARVRIAGTAGVWSQFSADKASFIIDTAAPAVPVVSTVGGSKVIGGKIKTSSQRPVFVGTAVNGSKVGIVIAPEGLSYAAVASSGGSWSITPSDDIPNGDHTVTVTATNASGNSAHADITLSVNPVPTTVAATPAPVASITPVTTPAPVAVASPDTTPAPTLAPTGDPIAPVSFLALAILSLSCIGLYAMSRRHEG